MPNSSTTAALNDALAALTSSLVQYSGECGPWIEADDDTELAALELFRRRQQLQVARLIELLGDRGATVELGRFPTKYTDLHFVSLESLYPRLIANQQAIIETLKKSAAACREDATADGLLADTIAEEERTLEDLGTLTAD
jgi:hypothetical protein